VTFKGSPAVQPTKAAYKGVEIVSNNICCVLRKRLLLKSYKLKLGQAFKPGDKNKQYVFYCEVKEKINDSVMAAHGLCSVKEHISRDRYVIAAVHSECLWYSKS